MKNFLNAPPKQAKVYSVDIENITVRFFLDNPFKTNNTGLLPEKALFNTIHYHAFFEFFLVDEVVLNILTMQDIRSYDHSIVIIPPTFKHSAINYNSYRFFIEFIKNKNSEVDLYDTVISLISTRDVTILPINNQIIKYLNQLDQLLPNGTYAKNLRIKSILTLLICEIIDEFNLKTNVKEISDYDKNYVTQIEKLINPNLNENITLQYLADRLFLCTKQVSRIIKKEYGLKLSELIKNKKMTVATLLLEKTNMTVQEISDTLAFNTTNYFFTLFKKEYGCSPLQYRKKHGAKLKKIKNN